LILTTAQKEASAIWYLARWSWEFPDLLSLWSSHDNRKESAQNSYG